MQPFTAALALAILTLVCAGFTIGLTYAPCYSSYCVEQFFPYEARLQVAFFYSLVASIAVALWLRASSETAKRISQAYIWDRPIWYAGKRLSVGGLLMIIWITGLTHATMGYWHDPAYRFWDARGAAVDWTSDMARLAYTTITGHWCDAAIGLVIIPVGRNSIIGNLFELHVSTLLFAHKLLALALLVYTVMHGAFYYAFVGAYAALPDDSPQKDQFNIDNPAFTIAESNPWNYATLATGMIAFILILVITITALPQLRRSNYNTFYYCHVICSLLIIIATCLHASTDFYCLLPGLLLWIADWVWRGAHGLKTRVQGELVNAGDDWYRIRIPATAYKGRTVDGEKAMENPLQTYYLNFPTISRWQGHAFTASAIGTESVGPCFLFQRSAGKKQKKLDKEWTWKLAAKAPVVRQRVELDVRIEGPYAPVVSELYEAAHVLCIAGGTGITGALCIADWWLRNRAGQRGTSFRLVWTVRDRMTAELDEFQAIKQRIESTPNATVQLQVTSESGRLDPLAVLEDARSPSGTNANATTGVAGTDAEKTVASTPGAGVVVDGTETEKNRMKESRAAPAWVYCSGPEGLLAATETACIKVARDVRRGKGAAATRADEVVAGGDAGVVESGGGTSGATKWSKMEFYIARWSL